MYESMGGNTLEKGLRDAVLFSTEEKQRKMPWSILYVVLWIIVLIMEELFCRSNTNSSPLHT